MPTLNRISAERLAECWDEQLQLLDELRQRAAQLPAGDARLAESLGRTAMDAALYGTALQRSPSELRTLLRSAARQLALGWAARPEPEEQSRRSPFASAQALQLIACFGSPEDRRLAAGLRPDQLQHPQRKAQAAMQALLRLLQDGLAGQAPDPARLSAALALCSEPRAGREEQLFIRPLLLALQALAACWGGDESEGLAADAADEGGGGGGGGGEGEGEEEGRRQRSEDLFNQSLAAVLAAHGEEARDGDYKYLPAGLVCLPALLLAHWAEQAGIDVRVQSGYLPLQLLEETGEAA